MPPKPPELDLSKLRLVPLSGRHSKVGLSDFGHPLEQPATLRAFGESLPNILGSKDLKEAARAIAKARDADRPVMLAMGGHAVKVGLGPIINDLLKKGILTSLSGNGSVMVHDTEVALMGATSEDVPASLDEGAFGVTDETGAIINEAARRAASEGRGLGESLADLLFSKNPPNARASVFLGARAAGAPFTVHVALGTDVFHIHPSANGAAMGEASMADFRRFAGIVATLSGGVFINLGSAVIMPEVFLKAVSLTRNLGFRQDGLTTVNMDFVRQYRPRVNVVERPTQSSGKGYDLTGHHEIMFPLLMGLALEYLRA